MKKILLATLLSVSPQIAAAETQIVIDFYDNVALSVEQDIEMKYPPLDLRYNSVHSVDDRIYVVDVPDNIPLAALLVALKQDPRVEFAEENVMYQVYSAPNDPLFSEQWNFKSIGAENAWKSGTGRGARIAVIDTGVAYSKDCKYPVIEDLEKTTFQVGYDFVNDHELACDGHGHGTHVSGTIAQVTNNKRGVAGLAYDAEIVPIKVLSDQGYGNIADISDGIRFAADAGAHAMNLSLGGGSPSQIMASAVKYARDKGTLVVCAAGNDGQRNVGYPAGYPGAIAVSSAGPGGKRAFYSNYGPRIDIGAPGGDKSVRAENGILQNVIVGGQPQRKDVYDYYQGTSMAAPHVAAAVALLVSVGMTNPDAIEHTLMETAKNPGDADRTDDFGAGIVQVDKAVAHADSGHLGGPLHLLGGVLLCFLAGAWPRKGLITSIPAGIALGLGLVCGSSGLWFLDGTFVDQVPVLGTLLTEPAPMWDVMAVGTVAHGSLLWWSCIPPITLTLLSFQKPRWRHFVLGVSIGWLVHIVVAAWQPQVDLWGTADQLWLWMNGFVLGLFAWFTLNAMIKA